MDSIFTKLEKKFDIYNMKKLILIFILTSGYLFSQSDSTKKWEIVGYKGSNSFYLYTLKNGGVYHYNFSSNEITDFRGMFWKSSKTMPLDTTMYEAYLRKKVGIADLHERIVKELK